MIDDLLLIPTPGDVERTLARRLRDARRARGWTQAELAARSAVSTATVARLERTGQGQIGSLVRICAALQRLSDFDALLKPDPPTTLDDLRARRGGGP